MTKSHYKLTCLECGRTHEDSSSGFLLSCDGAHPPALLRAQYANRQLTTYDAHPGPFRYSDWLPVRRILREAHGSILYQSRGLARHLRLNNLFIAFNGYWPEKGAFLETCSFKELEAYSVCARIPSGERRTMVVTSAGNTGMAFMQVCSENEVPVLVLVPEQAVPNLWTTVERRPNVILAAISGEADYFDTIEIGKRIAAMDEFYPEGGALNVARRDGMGTIVLQAAERLGRIPDHYVQAVGSGTGGIAAWEMSSRLRMDGRFGSNSMQLHFVQNAPFTIMTDSWQRSSRELLEMGEAEQRERISQLYAPVLSNRVPPYSVRGGVYDALADTLGHMYSVSEREAREAGELFRRLEGSDLHPAAEVALAGLIKTVALNRIGKNELVVLNVTGGGSVRLEREGRKRAVTPDIVVHKDDDVEELVGKLLSMNGMR